MKTKENNNKKIPTKQKQTLYHEKGISLSANFH